MGTIYDVTIAKKLINQQNLAKVAHNIANINTPGDKADKLVISGDESKSSFIDKLSYPKQNGVTRDLTQGPVKPTNNQLDFAISGAGYFAAGDKYTRNGSFTIDNDGKLITFTGEPILDRSKSAIIIPANAREFKVADDGSISIDNKATGQQIGIFGFEKETDLVKSDNSLYTTSAQAIPLNSSKVSQRHIEGSNTNPVLSMSQLIEIQRSDEQLSKVIQMQHDNAMNGIDETMVSST